MSTQRIDPYYPEWTWGDKVRKVRRDAGLSQADFAERLGTKSATVAAWEVGYNRPRDAVKHAKAIERAFGARVEWMLGLVDGPPPGPDDGGQTSEPYLSVAA